MLVDLSGGGIDEEIAAVFPIDLSGITVGLRTCIDASTHGTGTFAIAGVAFGYDRAVKANAEWARLMNGRTFHMTDLHARRGDFAGIEDDEVTEIMHGMVRILRNYASLMVVVSCDASLIAGSLPTVAGAGTISQELLNAFRSHYGAMCHLCMWGIGQRAGRNGNDSPSVSYVLEQGDDGQRGFSRFLDYISQVEGAPTLVPHYSLAGFTIQPKGVMQPIFHAADFVAWEWAKHVERRRQNSEARMRGSLAALVHGAGQAIDDLGFSVSDGVRVLFRHYSPHTMARYATFMSGMIAATTPSEVDAATDLWNATRDP